MPSSMLPNRAGVATEYGRDDESPPVPPRQGRERERDAGQDPESLERRRIWRWRLPLFGRASVPPDAITRGPGIEAAAAPEHRLVGSSYFP